MTRAAGQASRADACKARSASPVASDRPHRAPDAARRPGGIVGLLHAELAPDPNNPRKHFDLQELEDLATSIVVDGLLQNLVARETTRRTRTAFAT